MRKTPDIDYIEEHPCWVATLNNGESIYMYHDTTWQDLKEYCKSNELYIVDLLIRFRSNVVCLPSNKLGYFFRHGVGQWFGDEKTEQLFIVGFIQNGEIIVSKYRVPYMYLLDTETRPIIKDDPSCIVHPQLETNVLTVNT